MKKILLILLVVIFIFSAVGCELHENRKKDSDTKEVVASSENNESANSLETTSESATNETYEATTTDDSSDHIPEYKTTYAFNSIDELYLSLINDNKGIDIRSKSVGCYSEYDLMMKKFEASELELVYPMLNGKAFLEEVICMNAGLYYGLPWIEYWGEMEYSENKSHVFFIGISFVDLVDNDEIDDSYSFAEIISHNNTQDLREEMITVDGKTVKAIVTEEKKHTSLPITTFFRIDDYLVYIRMSERAFTDDFFNALSFEVYNASEEVPEN